MTQEESLAPQEATASDHSHGTGDGAKKSHLPEIPVAEVAHIASHEDLLKVLASHEQWTRAVLDPNVEVAVGRANLKGADLRGYDLAGVNLSGANLSGANLAGCDLEGANLTVANLERAILATCNLRHAKLRRARLDGADLRGADLTGAVLTGVDLSKAIVKTAEDLAAAQDPVKEQEQEQEQATQQASTAAAVAAAGGFKLAQQTVKSPVAAVKPDPELPPGVIL